MRSESTAGRPRATSTVPRGLAPSDRNVADFEFADQPPVGAAEGKGGGRIVDGTEPADLSAVYDRIGADAGHLVQKDAPVHLTAAPTAFLTEGEITADAGGAPL